jgi:NAD(P)-dependent dehydrogenase (short-subunit alcohol dehydrogenase family)
MRSERRLAEGTAVVTGGGRGIGASIARSLAPELVRKLATGRYDALAGRYIHAEHDDVDDLLARVDEIREDDLNAIRLRR